MNGWPRTLSWNDFSKIADPGRGQMAALNGHPIVARVAISIMFYAASSPTTAEGGPHRYTSVDVRVVLNSLGTQYVPSRIPAGQDARCLAHEQGHMDLMGLFAREMEVKLLRLKAPSAAALGQQANEAVDEAVRSARMYAINVPGMDCMYDQETNHGMNRGQQDRWKRLIARNVARWRQSDFSFRS